MDDKSKAKRTASEPEDHILREARNFAALFQVTGPYTPEQHAQMLKQWFEKRHAEIIAAALA